MENHRIVLTPHAVKRHSKRLNEILKNLGHSHNLMQSQEVFANILGIQSYHELNTILQNNNTTDRFIIPEKKFVEEKKSKFRAIIHDERTINALISSRASGLTVISGATGSGKRALLQHLVREIACTNQSHIGIMTDLFSVNYYNTQEETIIRKNTDDEMNAIDSMVRNNMDVIVGGEIRDTNSLLALIMAANMNHKVYTEVHASSVAETLNRMISLLDFSQREFLAESLIYALDTIINVRLESAIEGKIMIYEYLQLTEDIKRKLVEVYRNQSDNKNKICEIISQAMDKNETSLADMVLQEYRNGKVDKKLVKNILTSR